MVAETVRVACDDEGPGVGETQRAAQATRAPRCVREQQTPRTLHSSTIGHELIEIII